MKKVTLILALIGMITLQSCVKEEVIVDDNFDNDTISEVFELKNVNFSFNNSTGGYFIYRELNPQIYASDVILIYRLTDLINSNTPVWQLIPRTVFFDNGDELDYDFDFSKEDFTIYADGTYNLSNTPEFINNQTFRIVIVPGYFSKTTNSIDYSNYEEVIKYFGIDDKNVEIL
ncbi:hypothetical protein LXD69_12090 [Flavobacterium sediminilitoris]|uniref:Uncharacterized protein n=1 Tax=Flavobacterium sediminilitoris TaxID=2024526 RepID=A0ABY4HKD5_9FLAO|nr:MULTISPECIES: hypothetical protein [Flavobacterium]UOX32776.1 hypothetical protein LXD69_12090 [Flavobacterium sediminilitoris]